MSVALSARQDALRILHEHWNVPLYVLANVTRMSKQNLFDLAKRGAWQQGHSLASLQARFIEVLENQLNLINVQIEEEENSEKKVRLLTGLAKTLETVAAAETRLATAAAVVQKSQNLETRENNKKPQHGRRNTADLDRQLAELVQGLA